VRRPPKSSQPASERRLNPAVANLFDAGFDALEVIGTDGRPATQHFVGENIGDWFNMLNQGIRRTASPTPTRTSGDDARSTPAPTWPRP
jgi:hypothetical protein